MDTFDLDVEHHIFGDFERHIKLDEVLFVVAFDLTDAILNFGIVGEFREILEFFAVRDPVWTDFFGDEFGEFGIG